MDNDTQKALKLIGSTIHNCENMLIKFPEGKPQHTLLRNRIKALQISKCLIENNISKEDYTADDFKNTLPPVLSIIHKTTKAQGKYGENDSRKKRFQSIIDAMEIAKDSIEHEISLRSQEGQS